MKYILTLCFVWSFCSSVSSEEDPKLTVKSDVVKHLEKFIDTAVARLEEKLQERGTCDEKNKYGEHFAQIKKDDFELFFCEPSISGAHPDGVHVLGAKIDLLDHYPLFCQAISSSDPGDAGSYKISVDVIHVHGFHNLEKWNAGHTGLMFNVHDKFNYEFIFVSYHDLGGTTFCWKHGYVENLVYLGENSGACENGVPPFRKWYNLSIQVLSNKKAVLSWNGSRSVEVQTFYSPIRRGGLGTLTGFQDIMMFKNYKLEV